MSKCLNLYLDYPKLDYVSVVMSSILFHDTIPAFGHPNQDWAHSNLDCDVPNHLFNCALFEFGHPYPFGMSHLSVSVSLHPCGVP